MTQSLGQSLLNMVINLLKSDSIPTDKAYQSSISKTDKENKLDLSQPNRSEILLCPKNTTWPESLGKCGQISQGTGWNNSLKVPLISHNSLGIPCSLGWYSWQKAKSPLCKLGFSTHQNMNVCLTNIHLEVRISNSNYPRNGERESSGCKCCLGWVNSQTSWQLQRINDI